MPGTHNRAVGTVILDASSGTGQVGYGETPGSYTSIDFKLTSGHLYEVVVFQAGEECDAGSGNKDAQCGGGCSSTCQLNPSCGDANVDKACGEQCDDGLNSGGYGFCAPSCVLGPRCGDGKLQSDQGEECDNGDKNSDVAGSTCTTSCQKPGFCGDGILQAERVCDYGAQNTLPNNAAYGGCLTSCQLGPSCGDGIVQSPDEQCYRGASNGRSDADCSASCIGQVLVY